MFFLLFLSSTMTGFMDIGHVVDKTGSNLEQSMDYRDSDHIYSFSHWATLVRRGYMMF